jgi:histidinol-phosphate/aromatic aminotransferase/cobyric acid decarboxylase-like protein
LVPKRPELLRELRPQAGTIAFLVNPTNPVSAGDIEDMEEAARRVLSLHGFVVVDVAKAE